MARSHLYRPLLDDEGNLLFGAKVTVIESSVSVPLTQPIYQTSEGDTAQANPFIAEDGMLNLWLDTPQRVAVLVEHDSIDPLLAYLDALPPAPEVVQTAEPLRITNAPGPGLVLVGTDVPGQAEWRSYDPNGGWDDPDGNARVGGTDSRVGFFGSTGTTRPTISADANGNATLAALLQYLHDLNLIEWTGNP